MTVPSWSVGLAWFWLFMVMCIGSLPFTIVAASSSSIDLNRMQSLLWSPCADSGVNYSSSSPSVSSDLLSYLFGENFATLEQCTPLTKMQRSTTISSDFERGGRSLTADEFQILNRRCPYNVSWKALSVGFSASFPVTRPTRSSDIPLASIPCETLSRRLLHAYWCGIGMGGVAASLTDQEVSTTAPSSLIFGAWNLSWISSAIDSAAKCNDTSPEAGYRSLLWSLRVYFNHPTHFSPSSSNAFFLSQLGTSSPRPMYFWASCHKEVAVLSLCPDTSLLTQAANESAFLSSALVPIFSRSNDCKRSIQTRCTRCIPFLDDSTISQPYYFLIFPALKMFLVVSIQVFVLYQSERRIRKRLERFQVDRPPPANTHPPEFSAYIVKHLLKGGLYQIRLRATLRRRDGIHVIQNLFKQWKSGEKTEFSEEEWVAMTGSKACALRSATFSKETATMNYRFAAEKVLESTGPIGTMSESDDEEGLGSSSLNRVESMRKKSAVADSSSSSSTTIVQSAAATVPSSRQLTVADLANRVFDTECLLHQMEGEMEWYWQNVSLYGQRMYSGATHRLEKAFIRHLRIASRPHLSYYMKHESADQDDDVVVSLTELEEADLFDDALIGGSHQSAGIAKKTTKPFEYVIWCEEDNTVVELLSFLYVLLKKKYFKSDQARFASTKIQDIQLVSVDGKIVRPSVSDTLKELQAHQRNLISLLFPTSGIVDPKQKQFRRSNPQTWAPYLENGVLSIKFVMASTIEKVKERRATSGASIGGTSHSPQPATFGIQIHVPFLHELKVARESFLVSATFEQPKFEYKALLRATDQQLSRLLDRRWQSLFCEAILFFGIGDEVNYDYELKDEFQYRDDIPQITPEESRKKKFKKTLTVVKEGETTTTTTKEPVDDEKDKKDEKDGGEKDVSICFLEPFLRIREEDILAAEQHAKEVEAFDGRELEDDSSSAVFEPFSDESVSPSMALNNNNTDETSQQQHGEKKKKKKKRKKWIQTFGVPTADSETLLFESSNKDLPVWHLICDSAIPTTTTDNDPATSGKEESLQASSRRKALEQKSASPLLQRKVDPLVVKELYERVYEDFVKNTAEYKGGMRRAVVKVYKDNRLAVRRLLTELFDTLHVRLSAVHGDINSVSYQDLVADFRGQLEPYVRFVPIVQKEEQIYYTVFSVNVYALLLQYVFAIIFFVECIVAALDIGSRRSGFGVPESASYQFTLYEILYLRFMNSGTPVNLLGAAFINFLNNSSLRDTSYFYLFADWGLLAGSLMFVAPPLVTHLIPGTVLYVWVIVIVTLCLLFPSVLALKIYGRTAPRWTDRYLVTDPKVLFENHNKLKRYFTFCLLALQFSSVIVLTAIVQTTFNWALLFYRRGDYSVPPSSSSQGPNPPGMPLSYAQVLEYDWSTRSAACYLERSFVGSANVLQFLSSFFG